MTAIAPAPFDPWFRLDQGETLNKYLGYPVYSTEDSITATTTHTQAGGYQLTAQVSRVATVANAADAVTLPPALVGKNILVINSGTNSMQVYGNSTDTINGTAGATGIAQPASTMFEFTCTTAGAWLYTIANGSYTGTFDGVVGGNMPAAGTFTTLTATANVGPVPTAAGATLTLTAAKAGQTVLLNTLAGSVVTLPAATGTGNKYKFVVSATTTSGAHKILAASVSDFINGLAIGESSNTCKAFASAAATNHSIQMPFAGTQPSGGFIGDYFEFQDIATNLWQVNGMYQAGTTPTTPFSAATS